MNRPIDVIGGIRLASRDCRAQKNDMAANELLDVLGGVQELRTRLDAAVQALRESAKQHRACGDTGHANLLDTIADAGAATLDATKEAKHAG